MEVENLLQALLTIWEELPGLVGSEWLELYPRLEKIFTCIQSTKDAGKKASLVSDIVIEFEQYPKAKSRLRKVAQKIGRERGTKTRGGGGNSEPSNIPTLLDRFQNMFNPTVITRYTDITIPRALALGRRGVITVGLTQNPANESYDARLLKLMADQSLDICLQSKQESLEIIGESVKQILITEDKYSEPVVFYIKGISLGSKNLVIDFRQLGLSTSTVELIIEVVNEIQPEEQIEVIASQVTTNSFYAPPPDLDIRVMLTRQGGSTYLEYVLHSPNGTAGFHYQKIPGKEIIGSPEEYQAHLIKKIEALADGKDIDGHSLTPTQVENKLATIGRGLFEELFSMEMRNAYRKFRSVNTLQITSDEPWVPWELIKPYDDNDPDNIIDDDFFCMKFRLTRWLAGRSGPAARINIAALACIEAEGQPPLLFAPMEYQYIADIATAYNINNLSPNSATSEAVETLFDGGNIGLWHFAAHGNINLPHSNESAIFLSDGVRLRAEDINGLRQTYIARDRPIIFLNACRVGQQGWSLTRLGGWATALVDRCRCGAFIGPLWSVNDALAYEFAKTFYDKLREGKTIGEATQNARKRIRNIIPDNPTWLAYSVYAHPNMRVRFDKTL